MRLACLLFIAAAACAQRPKDDKENIDLPKSPADIARGKVLYLGSCTYCHGPTGDGGKGANLALAELPRAKNDGDLVRLIEVGIPGTEMPGAWHMSRREITQTAAFVRTLAQVDTRPTTGNAAHGKAVFRANGCGGCHTTKEDGRYTGGFAGPDLSGIGAGRSASHLRESIQTPEASVADTYIYTTVKTKQGATITGRTLNEDTFYILLRDLKGANHVLQKSAIASIDRDRKKSTMPSFQSKISGSDLEDLVAYLASMKEVQ